MQNFAANSFMNKTTASTLKNAFFMLMPFWDFYIWKQLFFGTCLHQWYNFYLNPLNLFNLFNMCIYEVSRRITIKGIWNERILKFSRLWLKVKQYAINILKHYFETSGKLRSKVFMMLQYYTNITYLPPDRWRTMINSLEDQICPKCI